MDANTLNETINDLLETINSERDTLHKEQDSIVEKLRQLDAKEEKVRLVRYFPFSIISAFAKVVSMIEGEDMDCFVYTVPKFSRLYSYSKVGILFKKGKYDSVDYQLKRFQEYLFRAAISTNDSTEYTSSLFEKFKKDYSFAPIFMTCFDSFNESDIIDLKYPYLKDFMRGLIFKRLNNQNFEITPEEIMEYASEFAKEYKTTRKRQLEE